MAKDRGAKPRIMNSQTGPAARRVLSNRPTHSKRLGRVYRGRRAFVAAPGSLRRLEQGAPCPTAEGTARTASPAPTRAAAGCIGTIW